MSAAYTQRAARQYRVVVSCFVRCYWSVEVKRRGNNATVLGANLRRDRAMRLGRQLARQMGVELEIR